MRVVVLGPGGSGKSLFARQLADVTGASWIEIDKIFWQPGLRVTIAAPVTRAPRLLDVAPQLAAEVAAPPPRRRSLPSRCGARSREDGRRPTKGAPAAHLPGKALKDL